MSPVDAVAAGLYLLPALVWGILARRLWTYVRTRQPRSRMLRLSPLFMATVALQFLLHVPWVLLPEDLRQQPVLLVRVLNGLVQALSLASLALALDLLRLTPVPEARPSRWITVSYAWAAVAIAVVLGLRLVSANEAAQALAASIWLAAYAPLAGLCLWHGIKLARPGTWGPESAAEVRRPDLIVIAAGLAVTVLASAVVAITGPSRLVPVVCEAGLGLAFVAPWTTRSLGVVITELLVSIGLLLGIAGLLGGRELALAAVDPRLRSVVHVGLLLGLGLLAVSGQQWLREAVDRLLFGRSRRRLAELQAFLHGLSPEIGTHECCRRALAELVRVRRLPGAAIILRDGEALVHGDFHLEPLVRVWPRGDAADALPATTFGTAELRELPLAMRDALIEANVGLGTCPILSPRRRWGHLFMNTGLLGGTFREDDAQEFQAFGAQLALLLDGADLLVRTVAVERSLAHAEKLAAIGETAARIAHEIRNPVTAARSLAQQLARDPTSPLNTESAQLILAELERVERQVAALLRFARREEFRFETIDLGELVRATVEQWRARCAQGGIQLGFESADGLRVRADAEKVRQVLVNLVDNAIDALAGATGPRRLGVTVGRLNGAATLDVTDTGPGVPSEALPRLFEPFFSLKEHGTGLGLAIARRTVEAHGGRIEASVPQEAGITFRVSLPLVDGAAG